MKTVLTNITLICFIVSSLLGNVPQVRADEFHLPVPGVMVHLSPDYNPPILKGIRVHADNPFQFEFILDKGDSELSQNQLKDQSTKLIKYFLASLTVPEKDLWVNLSPYEKDRIIPNNFGLTEMGRDLLGEDYLLKQITASLIYPEDQVGKKFWNRIYEESAKRYGTTNIPVNTFNKVWIVPEKAVVYENASLGTAYVVESRLKVMLEEDYLSLKKHEGIQSHQNQFIIQGLDPRQKYSGMTDVNKLGSQIVREIVLPELTKEVNEDKNFVRLRQVYNSLILATWYKKKIKDSILTLIYADKNKIVGVNINDPHEKQKIYLRYLKAFKKGVYNYVKDDINPLTQEIIPRKYFSGGVVLNLGASSMNAERVVQFFNDKTVHPAMLALIKRTILTGLLIASVSINVSFMRTPTKHLPVQKLVLAGQISSGIKNLTNSVNTKVGLSDFIEKLNEGKVTREDILFLLQEDEKESFEGSVLVDNAKILTKYLYKFSDLILNDYEVLSKVIKRVVFYKVNADQDTSNQSADLLKTLLKYVGPSIDTNIVLADIQKDVVAAEKAKSAAELEEAVKNAGNIVMVQENDLDNFLMGQSSNQKDLWSPEEIKDFKQWLGPLLEEHKDEIKQLFSDSNGQPIKKIKLTEIIKKVLPNLVIENFGKSLDISERKWVVDKKGTKEKKIINRFTLAEYIVDYKKKTPIDWQGIEERGTFAISAAGLMLLGLLSMALFGHDSKEVQIDFDRLKRMESIKGRPQRLRDIHPEEFTSNERILRQFDQLRLINEGFNEAWENGSVLNKDEIKVRDNWLNQAEIELLNTANLNHLKMTKSDEYSITRLQELVPKIESRLWQVNEQLPTNDQNSVSKVNRQMLRISRSIAGYQQEWINSSDRWLDLKRIDLWAADAQVKSDETSLLIKELRKLKSFGIYIKNLEKLQKALDNLWQPIDNDRIDRQLNKRKIKNKYKTPPIDETALREERRQQMINAKELVNRVLINVPFKEQKLFRTETQKLSHELEILIVEIQEMPIYKMSLKSREAMLDSYETSYRDLRIKAARMAEIAQNKGKAFVQIYNDQLLLDLIKAYNLIVKTRIDSRKSKARLTWERSKARIVSMKNIPKTIGNSVHEFKEAIEILGNSKAMDDRIFNHWNKAMASPTNGGIDLSAANMNLGIRARTLDGIKFHLNPAMLKRLINAPGFTPNVINVKPLNSLTQFLGISESQDLTKDS